MKLGHLNTAKLSSLLDDTEDILGDDADDEEE